MLTSDLGVMDENLVGLADLDFSYDINFSDNQWITRVSIDSKITSITKEEGPLFLQNPEIIYASQVRIERDSLYDSPKQRTLTAVTLYAETHNILNDITTRNK